MIYFLPQFTLIFWSSHILQRMFFSLYFWQLKEYRIDRFLEGVNRNKEIIFPKISVFALILLLIYFISLQFVFLEKYFIVFFFFIYLLFGVRALYLFFGGRWRLPKTTKKMILIIILTLFLFWFLVWFLFSNNFKLILVFEILLPIFIFLCLQIIQIPTFFAKKYIIYKAKQKRAQFKDLIVVGITGSHGKSSTKEFLHTLLSEKFNGINVLKTEGNINTEMGVADTILKKLKKEHQVFVCEMAAYKKGEIKSICDIVKPKLGIVTGVSEQHLSLFGTMENLLSSEGGRELAESLPKGGVLFLNADNKYCRNLYKRTSVAKKIYTVKRDKIDSDIWTEDIRVTIESVSFIALTKDREMAYFKVNVLGDHNIQNFLAAILVANELGMSLEEIADACKNIKQEQAGIVLKEGKHGVNIIDSSYSSNPDGVIADLEYLSIFPKKKAIIMPCLIELGGKSAEIHERIGKKIGEMCDLAIITTREMFKEIKKGAIASGMKEKNIVFCENPEEILTRISIFCAKGDAVLLEGRVPEKLISKLLPS